MCVAGRTRVLSLSLSRVCAHVCTRARAHARTRACARTHRHRAPPHRHHHARAPVVGFTARTCVRPACGAAPGHLEWHCSVAAGALLVVAPPFPAHSCRTYTDTAHVPATPWPRRCIGSPASTHLPWPADMVHVPYVWHCGRCVCVCDLVGVELPSRQWGAAPMAERNVLRSPVCWLTIDAWSLRRP